MSERPIPKVSSAEYPTAARSSFASEALGIQDTIYRHPSGKIRFLSYPKKRSPKNEVLEQLISKGLIIGKRAEDDSGKLVFVIPRSSRPLTHEAASGSEGAFTYGDDELFFDLGMCLGTVASTSRNESTWRVVQSPPETSLGSLVSIQEFTRPGEARLGLIPGVEQCVVEVDKRIFPDPIAAYGRQLEGVFGSRFQDAAIYFRMGFNEPLGGLENE